MKDKIRILETYKSVKEISKVIEPDHKLTANDTFYHTKKDPNLCVNLVKQLDNLVLNEFNDNNTIWYEKTRTDFKDNILEKNNETHLVFYLDRVRLSGSHEYRYKYLGAFQLEKMYEQKAYKVREWHYITGFDVIEK